jgi:hypothetical protein
VDHLVSSYLDDQYTSVHNRYSREILTDLVSAVKEDGGVLPDFDTRKPWRDILALTLVAFSVSSNETFPNLSFDQTGSLRQS